MVGEPLISIKRIIQNITQITLSENSILFIVFMHLALKVLCINEITFPPKTVVCSRGNTFVLTSPHGAVIHLNLAEHGPWLHVCDSGGLSEDLQP